MTTDDMLRRAAECLVLAKAAQHLDARLVLLEVAQTWVNLARQADATEITNGAIADAVMRQQEITNGSC